jgi:xanthine dehydrogenase YagR molybdenum-binding subunit
MAAPVTLDQTYTTPDESHAAMEPHATIAAVGRREADAMDVEPDDRLGQTRRGQNSRHSGREPPDRLPLHRRRFRRQVVRACRRCARRLGSPRCGSARQGRPDQAYGRQQHDPSTRDYPAYPHWRRRDGKIIAIAHESTSGNLPDGKPETAVDQTRLLYAGPNRLTAMRLAVLDLPEGNAMRAPVKPPA